MSTQKFTWTVRCAIWEAHGKVCVFCHCPISFRELVIDHIIPEKYLLNPEGFEEIRSEAGLPDEFDLRGFENLIPTCCVCNNQKGDILMHHPRLLLILEIANQKKQNVLEKIKDYERQDHSDRLRLKLLAAIKNGVITANEIEQFLKDEKTSKGLFDINKGLDIFDSSPIRELSGNDVEQLLNKPVSLPDGFDTFLTLIDDSDNQVFVRTLAEYQLAASQGFYPPSNLHSKICLHYFILPLEILNAILSASYAEISYIDNPRHGLNNIHLLPIELLCNFGERGLFDRHLQKVHQGMLCECSIGCLINSGIVQLVNVSNNSIELKHNGQLTFMFEIMRADLNNDGIQDLLIYVHCSLEVGTMAYGGTNVLTRYGEDENFSLVK